MYINAFEVKISYFTVLKVKFDFAIIISGFKSLCTLHKIYYDEKIIIPSLHIYGETDQVIPTGESLILYLQNLFLLYKYFL